MLTKIGINVIILLLTTNGKFQLKIVKFIKLIMIIHVKRLIRWLTVKITGKSWNFSENGF